VVTEDMVKAERVIRKFSRRVHVRHARSVEFIYSGWPIKREVCMVCLQHNQTGTCPLNEEMCPAEQIREEALIGLRALQYARVKAKIVFPAP